MKNKCKCPEGVPDWVVTYGDMMSLLLCFFILLAAFSELKKEEEFQDVVRAVQEAFGYTGGAGFVPSQESPTTSIIKRIDAINLHREKNRRISRADDPGVTGKDTVVKKVREGLQFTIGGRVTFEPGSARLMDSVKDQLNAVAEAIRGQNNKVEIRGHCSNDDLPAGASPQDFWQLSYQRALAVEQYLTAPPCNIDARRLRVVACSNYEPLAQRVYDPSQVAVNRRVEVIATEALVADFEDNERPNPVLEIER
ncbi:flagellar motor protein MotB [Planctomycetales bacterium ZRK34]|nr:flagellar motor protein MotB [Planctomycetales bacterium ZRK34]